MNNKEFPYSRLEHFGRDFASRGVVVLAPEELGLPAVIHGQIYEQERRAVQAKKPVTCALIPAVLDVINAPGVVAACNQLVGENWAIVPFTHNASFASGARDQAWHKDDNGPYNSRKQRHHQAVQIEMLYYPQAVLDDMGPTATAPYSHYLTFNHEENQDNFAGADHLDFDFQLTGMEREPVSGPDSSYTEQDILQRNTAHDVRMRDAVTDLQWPLVQQLETAPLRAGSVVFYSHNTFHRGNHRRDDWRTWADNPRFMWRFWIYRTTEPAAGNGRPMTPAAVDWNRLGTDPMTGADLATATDDVTVVWRHHHHWMQTGQPPPPRPEAVSLTTTAREAEAQRLLVQLQEKHDTAEPARIGAAYKLASIGDTAVALRHLEQGLYSDRESVRRAATYGLVAVGTDATETLLEAATSPIRWVRKAGVYGLGDASQLTEPVLRAVAACLQDDPSVYVRSVAAGSLGCLGRRAAGTGIGRDLVPRCLDALVQSLGREVNRVAMDRAQKRSIKYVRPTDDCDVCEGGGVDFGLERFQPVRSAVRENVLWSIVILCSHGASIVGAALAPTILALRDVVRNDDNVICVGVAMDALNRLAHLRPADETVLPAVSDLQADMPKILASSPIQCWEALVRGDGTCRPTDA